MGIASALPAPDGCLPACVMVLVAQDNRDRPARLRGTPQSGAAAVVRLWPAVREPVLLHLPRQPRISTGGRADSEHSVEYPCALALLLLP